MQGANQHGGTEEKTALSKMPPRGIGIGLPPQVPSIPHSYTNRKQVEAVGSGDKGESEQGNSLDFI